MFGDESVRKRNIGFSIFAGLLFSAGWWIFVDAISQSDKNSTGAGKYYEYFPGILATLGLFLINNLPDSMFYRDAYGFTETPVYCKILLVISVCLILGGLIECVWVFLAVPLFKDTADKIVKWRGIAEIIQTILISISAFVWRFFYKDPNA